MCCVWLNKLLYHFLLKYVVSQLVHKSSTLNWTLKFIIAFIRVPSLSGVRSIQSITSHFIFWKSILIIPSHLHLSFPSGLPRFPTKPHPRPCHSTWFIARKICGECKLWSSALWNFSQFHQSFVRCILILFSKLNLGFQNGPFHIFRRKFHISHVHRQGCMFVLHRIPIWSS